MSRSQATTVYKTTGGGSAYQYPLSGTVNGTNTVFTWAIAPNGIEVDGAGYQKSEQGGTANWSGTTTTILLVAPTQSVFAFC